MKVLFAVSNESISDAIVKKYQQMYKEIISSKNVYYFNAIIKELQKDKSYDRIVISEELEPFVSKNYDTIDNFLFEKLDSISDEASNGQGEDIPIILITTERRTKGENILVKLFGIGVYSALIGQDRSIEQVCNLINKPRSKKDAKIYYKISSDEVEYKYEKEGNVSEIEIQNILAHYKKLGKNEDKYVESFNSISNQYTDAQLRLIIKFLPLNVKAVLEANCPKYQQVVAYEGGANENYRNPQSKIAKKQEKQQKTDKRAEKAGLKIESIKSEKNNTILSKPVIIPSEVTTENVKKVSYKQSNEKRTVENQMNNMTQIEEQEKMNQTNKTGFQGGQVQNSQMSRPINQGMQGQNPQIGQVSQGMQGQNPQIRQVNQGMQGQNPQVRQVNQGVQGQNHQMTQINQENPQIGQMNQGMQGQNPQIRQVNQGMQNQNPQMSKTTIQEQKNQVEDIIEDIPQIDSTQEIHDIQNQSKRGRGRPKKNQNEVGVDTNIEAQPKRGRGRPKKVQLENDIENNINTETENILPGFENYNEANVNQYENTENELPGFESYDENNVNQYENEEAKLPGFEDIQDNEQSYNEEENVLPGFNDIEENQDDGILPGFNDDLDNTPKDTNNSEYSNQQNNEQSYDSTTLPGIEDYNMNYEFEQDNNDEGMLPGFENYDENQFDNFGMQNDSMPSGIDNNINGQNLNNTQNYNNINQNNVEQETNNVNSSYNENQNYSYNNETEFNNMNQGYNDFQESNNVAQAYNTNTNYNTNGSNFKMNTNEEQITTQNTVNSASTESLISGDKKIVGFVGTSKNGTSFIVDNLAQMLSRQGIKMAILDLTKNKNAYYIYTKNEEQLRKTAMNCMKKLEQGITEGIKVNPKLDVYTSVPGEEEELNIDNIINTLMNAYSLILVDCDFKSDYRYIAKLQELYLVQSMDVLTIQPLTAYLRDLKAKGVLDQSKLRIVINKYIRVRSLTEKTIIGGMAFYNDPAMSFMTELFNRETIKYTVIPFDMQAYSKYLEGLVNCEISTDGYSKEIITELRKLANMVYPMVTSGVKYDKINKKQKSQYGQYEKGFSPQMNDTLSRMKSNQ